MTISRNEMAALLAQDIPDHSYVNLGIGLPTLVAEHLPEDKTIILHTENGMLNMGPAAEEGEIDPDLMNAGKIPVTELPGAAYFDHALSFGMMRGGHLDYCVLGAFQVSQNGDLANWHTGAEGSIPAVGGAMDLAIGAKNVYVIMNLFTKDGTPKLTTELTYPATGLSCVDRIYTDYAIFEPNKTEGFTVLKKFTDLDLEELAHKLGVNLTEAEAVNDAETV